MEFKKLTVLVVVILTLLAFLAICYAWWMKTLEISDTVQTGHMNADFIACSSNDPPGSIDPGKDKDVGWCTTELFDSNCNGFYDQVIVTMGNAYPCYDCDLLATVHNGGTVPERIASIDIISPPEIMVSHVDLVGAVLDPGEQVDGRFLVHVEQEALQGHTYTFTIKMTVTPWIFGTIGFWKKWNRHNTFTQQQIEDWLTTIDAESSWLGPTTTQGMESVYDKASGGTQQDKFFGHYLATRLNVKAGILRATVPHNVTTYDQMNYLDLADPSSATLAEIISAIENKYSTLPTNNQFEIMKNVCDALNNLSI